MRAGINKVFAENVLLIILNKFNENKDLVNTMLRYSKRNELVKLVKLEQNDVKHDVIGPKRDTISR